MRIWAERPARADVEAVVRRYFGLLRAGRMVEAGQLIEGGSVRHVLHSLWTGSVAAVGEGEEVGAAEVGDGDTSWLGELDLAGFRWGDTGSHVSVEVTCRGRVIEVELSFWAKPVDAGWVVAGPATLW